MYSEKNKIIAEYMGEIQNELDYYHIQKFKKWTPILYSYDFENKEIFKSDELEYHKSWDWLIPVVHKILSNSYTLEGVRRMKNVQLIFTTCDILKVHDEVYKFICWYLNK